MQRQGTPHVADSNHNGTGAGGGIAEYASFANTIVAGNRDLDQDPLLRRPDCVDASPLAHNLIEDPNGCAPPAGNILGIAPKLGPLAANGGRTRTHMPSAGSPAIDHGSAASGAFSGGACTRRDQRGVKRPQGRRCDIGAVERRQSKKP